MAVELVDVHDAGDLSHEAFDEPEVAAGDLVDGVDGLGVVGVAGVEWLAELVPVLGEHGRDVVGVERLVLVGEPDPAVELRVAGELPVEAGHADQDQAEVASVEEVPELLQPGGFQAVGLVDDHQFGAALGSARRTRGRIRG